MKNKTLRRLVSNSLKSQRCHIRFEIERLKQQEIEDRELEDAIFDLTKGDYERSLEYERQYRNKMKNDNIKEILHQIAVIVSMFIIVIGIFWLLFQSGYWFGFLSH